MEIKVLGRVSISRDGETPLSRITKPLQLLVLLSISPGCAATHEEVIRCLWAGVPVPRDRIRSCVRDLRALFPQNVRRMSSKSCSILLSPFDVDYLRFREGLTRARSQSGVERMATLDEALAEWDDDGPLCNLTGSGFEESRMRLRREWHDATVQYLKAVVDAEEIARALQDIRSALDRWPSSEDLFEIHLPLVAECRGEQEVRREMRDWVKRNGEATGAISAIFENLTRQPPGAGVSRRTPGIGYVVPRELPHSGSGLVGRRPQIAELSHVLLNERRGMDRLAAVIGMPGVGKTTLAINWARSAEKSFVDGTLYADLNGFTWDAPELVQPDRVLARFLASLGVRTKTPTLEDKVAAYRSVLAERSVLVVLDNVRNTEQVRPLLPGSASCATIVTSRNTLQGLTIREGARLVRVEPLGEVEAVTVLRVALGESHQHTVGHMLSRLADLCGRLPLALAVIATSIRGRSSDSVRRLVGILEEEKTRLDTLGLADHDLSVRLALDCSYRALSPEAARLLWQVGVHQGPSIGWAGLMDVGSVGNEGDVERAIDELVVANLLNLASDRYTLHDLVRTYAREAAREAAPNLRDETARRVLEYTLHHVWACDQVLVPGRRLPVGDPGETEVVVPGDKAEAMAWLDREYGTVMATIRHAQQEKSVGYAWLLPVALITYQWRRSFYADAKGNMLAALEAVERDAGPGEQAMVRRMLSGSCRGLGEYELAKLHLRQAVRLCESDPDRWNLARSVHALAILQQDMGELTEAAGRFEEALDIFQQLQDPLGEAAALNGIGSVHYDAGAYGEALRYCNKALEAFDSTADLNGRADVLVTIGDIHGAQENRQFAVTHYRSAIAIYGELSYRRNEAATLRSLFGVLIDVGKKEDALQALERALTLLRELGDQDAKAVAASIQELRGEE